MRPEILFPLFAPVETIKGVGPKLAQAIGRLAGERVVDLLWHLPYGVIDRRLMGGLSAIERGRIVTLSLRVLRHDKPPNRRVPYRVACVSENGEAVSLVFFAGDAGYIGRLLPVGSERIVSGQLDIYSGMPQIAHPDYVVKPADRAEIPDFEPVYPLTEGLTNRRLHGLALLALERVPALPEWLDPAMVAREGWPAWAAALGSVHRPEGPNAVALESEARRRLAYDEFLANQLAFALVRARAKSVKGRAVEGSGDLFGRVRAGLEFQLTAAQERSIEEILADMADEAAMLRLLQGDVGAGKTLVALAALLNAVEAGGQGALLAPTEILARQHGATLEELCRPLDIRIAVLTGRDKGKKREALLSAIADGDVDIVVGTHALFQKDVDYQNLLLAVIDEQHRFGVHQRLDLTAKSSGKMDVLVMTATPIPRTLTLACYGEMDVSRLDEKPPGRKPVDTRVVSVERLDEVVTGLKRVVARGERIYWVCPLVEDSEKIDLAAAEARYGDLKKIFGEAVGLVHGRLKAKEKEDVLGRFRTGELSLLVATTVIEVGVDVPEATVMVVEQAERFGLAQLHQLRGRVGRGGASATCLLLRGAHLSESGRKRLEIMRQTDDGFVIAEEDLKLRGAGELLGTRQSGFPEFRLADVSAHADLLATAQSDARLILERDRRLRTERGEACRILLYLFERDRAARFLHSG